MSPTNPAWISIARIRELGGLSRFELPPPLK